VERFSAVLLTIYPQVAAVLSGEARWCVVEADCLDVLGALPERCAQHVITDPPYDKRTHANAITAGAKEATGVSFAALESPSRLAVDLLRVARRWVLAFCACESFGEYAAGAGDSWIRAGIWDKINPTPQLTGDRPGQAVEGISIMHGADKKRWNKSGCAGIWRFAPPHGDDRPDHPTPKPLPLMLALLGDFTDLDDLILDPFAGSGTTGVAALRLGRRCILIEKDPKSAALCRERMLAEKSGSTLQARRAGQLALLP
jgi:site-specific DNA-methyltransferase (adenine-specific)